MSRTKACESRRAAVQRLERQYLYFRTSNASKYSTEDQRAHTAQEHVNDVGTESSSAVRICTFVLVKQAN